MKRCLALLLAVLACSVSLVAAAQPTPSASAPAPRPVHPAAASQIEVLVLEGSSGPGGIQPNLATQFPQLTHPPFSAYSSISMHSQTRVALGSPGSQVTLPGGNADISLVSVLPNGRFQVRVHVSINGRGHDVVFAAALNDPFFTVHQNGSASTALILGFIVH